jgi:hypothetical protein
MKSLPKLFATWPTLDAKSLLAVPALSAVLLLSGCASHANKLALAPVGPAPMPTADGQSTDGSLVVYSALESYPDLNAENAGWDTKHQDYSSYKILRADGTPLKSVANNAGRWTLHPQQVELPAGEYRIVAEANGYGRVKVPIIIAVNRVTVLHLDGDGFWPHEYGFNTTNSVQLPNGQIIGWRADVRERPAS